MRWVIQLLKGEAKNLKYFLEDCKRRKRDYPERKSDIDKQYRYYRNKLQAIRTAIAILKS